MRRLLTHDLHAERVEGADRQLVDGHFAAFLAGRRERPAFEQLRRALAHFERGLVREGERGDVLRLEAPAFDQVRDFLRDHARLAAAGAGEHETGTIEIAHRFVLRGVETCGHRVWTLRGVGRKDRCNRRMDSEIGRHRGARNFEKRDVNTDKSADRWRWIWPRARDWRAGSLTGFRLRIPEYKKIGGPGAGAYDAAVNPRRSRSKPPSSRRSMPQY